MFLEIRWALVAMVALTIVAIMASPADLTQKIISDFAPTFTSTVYQAREFCRRTLTSIPLDNPFVDRARILALDHFNAIHDATRECLTPYIDGWRLFVAKAIEESESLSELFRPENNNTQLEPYNPFQISMESVTYACEPGWCPSWGSPPFEAPPRRPELIPTVNTLVFVVATNVFVAILTSSIMSVLSITSAIFSATLSTTLTILAIVLAALRLVWRSTIGRVRLPATLDVDWEEAIEKVCLCLAMIAAGGFHMLVASLASLVFFIVNTALWVANRDVGLKLASLEMPKPHVIYRTVNDPRVPKLQEENRKVHDQLASTVELLEHIRKQYDMDINQLDGEIEDLRHEKNRQKAVIVGQLKMMAKVDMTQSLYDQLKAVQNRIEELEKEKYLAAEAHKQTDAWYSKQLGDQFEDLRETRRKLNVAQDETESVRNELRCCQFDLESNNQIAGRSEKSLRDRIQKLEMTLASKEEGLNNLRKEHELVFASHREAMGSLTQQIKRRDEVIETQKNGLQGLEAHLKAQEELHASEMKSESAKWEQAVNTLRDDCEKNSNAGKEAEAKLEAETEARKAAEQRSAALEKQLKEKEAMITFFKQQRVSQEAGPSNPPSSPQPSAPVEYRRTVVPRSVKWKLTGGSGAENKGTVPTTGGHKNGAEIPPMNSFNFGASTAQGIFGGGGPSPQPETHPTATSPAPPSNGEDTSAKAPSGTKEVKQPNPANLTPEDDTHDDFFDDLYDEPSNDASEPTSAEPPKDTKETEQPSPGNLTEEESDVDDIFYDIYDD
jgi:hypothetical protein